ncbi:hypothetical protein EX895_003210 [Sporisorium graminicola]|uniref:Transcription initiation factor TFIID subunit 11 n=1 Tax=Sporisorium graminicola TaxID=280036 RepID=A0A4V6ETQ8_9BASI|nr:hypothetical protein EX895_003210 [Sporisorium graminicola]TKY87629.1 hypothetical protein EX895_003210 [Sporisorium graminicola]
MSSSQPPADGNMPNMAEEGVIPASFFDMPIEYGSGNDQVDFGSLSAFATTDAAMPSASDFDALTAQLAASIPSLSAATYPPASDPPPQPFVPAASVKMESDEPSAAATSSSTPVAASTPKSTAQKAKKPAKPKADGSEAKPKKSKKKPAADADAGPSATSAQASKDTAASPAPKPKKASKKKPADKEKGKETAPSATASPAPFATPASPSKDPKPKSKKAAGSKAGGKAASKARSTTARSASRMSSIGRDAATPAATSRMGSQRPQDEANDDEEPAPNRPAPQEEEEAEDEEVEADDGVEELGKDHFSTQEAIYAAQQRNMGLLSMVMDEDQLDRHMASRRGALNKTSVRKLVNHVLSQSVSQHVAMVVSGVAKIFVGEIIEKAREIQSARGEQGPLRPNHLREAHRQYYLKRERPGHYPPGTTTGFAGVGKRRRMF